MTDDITDDPANDGPDEPEDPTDDDQDGTPEPDVAGGIPDVATDPAEE